MSSVSDYVPLLTTLVGVLVFVFYFERIKTKTIDIVPNNAMIGNNVYIADQYDTGSREHLLRNVGYKNWHSPQEEPGVMYGQLPDGQIMREYYNDKS